MNRELQFTVRNCKREIESFNSSVLTQEIGVKMQVRFQCDIWAFSSCVVPPGFPGQINRETNMSFQETNRRRSSFPIQNACFVVMFIQYGRY